MSIKSSPEFAALQRALRETEGGGYEPRGYCDCETCVEGKRIFSMYFSYEEGLALAEKIFEMKEES